MWGWTVDLGPCEPWNVSENEATGGAGVVASATAIYAVDSIDGGDNGMDARVTALNLDGTQLWSTVHGGLGDDRLRSVTLTASGAIYAYGDSTSSSNGSQDGWLVRIDPSNGALLGQWHFGTLIGGLSVPDLAARVLYDPASASTEGLLLVGTAMTGAANQRQVTVRRVLLGGGLHWLRLYGGSGEEDGYGVSHSPNSTHVVVGRSSTASTGGVAALLLRMDDWGNTSCAEGACYGTSVDTCSDGIACTADQCNATTGQCSWPLIQPCSP